MPHRFLLFALLWLLTVPAGAAELGAANDPDLLPGSTASTGRTIAEAWLVLPTTRYDHFVHANRNEAGGLRVRLADGGVQEVILGPSQVFEDSIARVADLDGDGSDEVAVVLTSLQKGASLAVYGMSRGKLELRAQTAFIGQPHRWLNPAAIADFDGDGHLEIALVQMPHLVKRLELWRLTGKRLLRVEAVEDVSNHHIGTTQTGLAAVADFDNDGTLDIAIPDGARTTIRILSFSGGKLREIGRQPLPHPANGPMTVRTQSGAFELSVRLEGGSTYKIALPRPAG